MHPIARWEELLLTLITGSILSLCRYLKLLRESYAPSPITLAMFALDDACWTRGWSILPSGVSSFVTSTESIFPVLTSTATWNLMNPLFTLHLWRIHSPRLETLMPVESTAIVTSFVLSTEGSISTLTLATLHHIVE